MATLKTTVTETLTLNGKVYGNTISADLTGVNSIHQTILSVTTATTVSLVAFTAANAELGQIQDGTLKYFRVTNIDSTNYIDVLLGAGGDAVKQRVNAGESFIITADQVDYGSGFVQLDNIKAQANTADVDVEIFVATT